MVFNYRCQLKFTNMHMSNKIMFLVSTNKSRDQQMQTQTKGLEEKNCSKLSVFSFENPCFSMSKFIFVLESNYIIIIQAES